MMHINGLDDKRIQFACNHEAGHYFVGRYLSFKTNVISIIIHPFHGHLGSSEIEPWEPHITDIEKIEHYLERRIQVLYAGVIAESLKKYGEFNYEFAKSEWEEGGGKDDFAKIKVLIQVLRNIKFPETINESDTQSELNELTSELIKRAGKIILENLDIINKISNNLIQKIALYDVKYELNSDEIELIQSIY